MSKKATVIWRYILGALIIVLSVVMIIGLTSCESVDTDDYQETITDESEIKSDSESKSEIKSDSETKPQQETGTKPESEKETIQTQKVEGMITKLYKPSDDRPYYLFKLEDGENWYRFSGLDSSNNQIFLDLGMEVSIEYVESGEDGIYIIQKIHLFESEEDNIQSQKAEGIITEFYTEPRDDRTYYYFKLEGSDNLYRLLVMHSNKNPWIPEVGIKVSVEYVKSGQEGVYIIQRISF